MYAKKKKIHRAYVSKHNSNHQKQTIFLMIPKRERWIYITVKQLPAIFRDITSKRHYDFYYLNCLRSFITENKLKSHKKVCEHKDFSNIKMPFERN